MTRSSGEPGWIYDPEADEWISPDRRTTISGELVRLADRAIGYERLLSDSLLDGLTTARLNALCSPAGIRPARDRSLILVVDDDDTLRSVVAEFLADEGFRVQVAGDGAEALAIVDATRPTLIVLDLYLPTVDGWAFAEELRSRSIEVPIIVMSGSGHIQKSAREIGAKDYFAKPVPLESLLKRIDDLCA